VLLFALVSSYNHSIYDAYINVKYYFRKIKTGGYINSQISKYLAFGVTWCVHTAEGFFSGKGRAKKNKIK